MGVATISDLHVGPEFPVDRLSFAKILTVFDTDVLDGILEDRERRGIVEAELTSRSPRCRKGSLSQVNVRIDGASASVGRKSMQSRIGVGRDTSDSLGDIAMHKEVPGGTVEDN